MHLAVFITRHVPHDKVNVIGDGIGLEASLCRREPCQSLVQSSQVFVQPYAEDLFIVHTFLMF
jgi:hypothetical protein